MEVFPPARVTLDPALQQLHGEVRAPRTRGIPFGEEDCSETVRDPEVWIQHRHEVQQRVQRVEASGRTLRTQFPSVVDDGADPVDVGRDVVVAEHQALEQRAGLDPQQWVRRLVGLPPAIANDLDTHRGGQQGRDDHDRQEGARPRHLKSRRRKMATAAASNIPEYNAPYRSVYATCRAPTDSP